MKKQFDIVILAAAASDYIPKNQYPKKIKSTKNSLTIQLKKAPKIIDHIKKLQKYLEIYENTLTNFQKKHH